MINQKNPLDFQKRQRHFSAIPSTRNIFSDNFIITPLENFNKTPNIPLSGTGILTQNKNIFTKIEPKFDINCTLRARTPIVHTITRSFTIDTSKDSLLYRGSIDSYSFGCTLGSGASAVVKEAIFRPTRKKYAIKTYEKSKLLDPQKKRNLTREIKIMKKLDHQNIVNFHEAIDTTKHIHIAMEYVNGYSLHSYIKRRPNRILPESEARRIFSQVISAIEYCHNMCITHRDIKLENILLDDHLNVKIIDFGFSTLVPNDKLIKIFCGTPSYMAPEIVSKREYLGWAADIWALGVLLYVLLTGTYPFKGQTDREVYKKIIEGYFEIPRHVTPPARLLIKRMMQKDFNKRPHCSQIKEDPWMHPEILGVSKESIENIVDFKEKRKIARDDKENL
ncbi:unnamed protein product [Blepharisma stoltei]|uniref:Protein kinase domain-containing protein n=1 Tax=Blepharisma stoltei TaxID=1481888 RepID=A0AAU9K1D2_9CILI|nr:unnamed protein product [Blepharisma stoltei]